MIVKHGLAGLAGAVLLAGVAVAQTQAPQMQAPATRMDSSAPSASSTATQSHQGLWRASKLVGVSVYNDSNESLGKINDIVIDHNGGIKNVIIGVGGFLGVGERYIAVSFDKLKWSDDPVRTAAATPPVGGPPAPAGGMDRSRTVGTTATMPPPSMPKVDAWYPDHAVLSATKDDVKAMPEFRY
ncbi:MAG: PRC-barrel domain-containing protein [Pseudomonadota bacterium]|jgi:sporulation protein YlmC with PRC-barrel domain